MNKTELINEVAKKASLDKKNATVAVNAVIDAITETVVAGDKVQLIGFGTFESKACAAREGRDPRTGNKIKIPASKRPTFSAGKTFKDAVNK